MHTQIDPALISSSRDPVLIHRQIYLFRNYSSLFRIVIFIFHFSSPFHKKAAGFGLAKWLNLRNSYLVGK